ncbi:hypothetical protein SUGI_0436340 [Cryptomeria japonica]|nr:hypothetical protein SUGI_0436340 [Cryptomeria japonica]
MERGITILQRIGAGLVFGIVGMIIAAMEFFYSQVPDGMRSLRVASNMTATGIGSFVSSFVINIVNSVSGKMGQRWLLDNLNTSRLDKFYWLPVALNALNLLAFIFIARR